MSFNTASMENVSGVAAIQGLNEVLGTWPFMTILIVLTIVMYSTAHQMMKNEKALMLASFFMGLSSVFLWLGGFLSNVPGGIAVFLSVVTFIFAFVASKPQTL